jgi:hypothetical protein
MSTTGKWGIGILGLVLAGAVAIQFVPVTRTNPPVTGEIEAPDAVTAVLARSCYDCHSHETQWPWYSRVAPVSWLVAHDVEEGREHLNFSTWTELSSETRAHLTHEIVEEVEEGEMPLKVYLLMHADAEVSAEDLETLRGWAAEAETEHETGHAEHEHAE